MTSLAQPDQLVAPLSEADAEIYVASVCFKTGPPGQVGIEVERTVHHSGDPARPVTVSQVRSAVASAGNPLPGGGLVTFEPGGQLEISSACAPSLPEAISATRTDLDAAQASLDAAGLRLGDFALDPLRPAVRSLDLPRYVAMEQQFDRSGPAGRTMMCSTAALQVSLDAGHDDDSPAGAVQRWRRLHLLAPVLCAMFANSPFRNGAPPGWRSGRQAAWLAIDSSRTEPPRALTDDPRADWARYALDANVLCIRPVDDGDGWQAPVALSMRGWLRGEGPRPVTRQDLDYHLTTLFPPVRPRGFLELRVIDAQAGGEWEVPAAVIAALVEDPVAAELAEEACRRIPASADLLTVAARHGLSRPDFARAARRCAEAACEALPRLGADPETRARVAAYVDRYTARDRTPADDALDEWHRTGYAGPFHASRPENSKERS